MTTRDDIDIARLQEAFAAQTGLPTEDCPSPETIWSAFRGELPADEIRDVVDHTSCCVSCAEDWRLAAAFEQESGSRRAEPAPVRRTRFARLGSWAAAAAAVLALMVVGVQQREWGPPDESPVYREGARVVVRSLVGEALPRDRALLRWSPGPEAATYDLLVSSEDLDVLATAKDLDAPQYRVPPSAFKGLSTPSTILWRVETILPDGSRHRSPTFRTTVR